MKSLLEQGKEIKEILLNERTKSGEKIKGYEHRMVSKL